jgi:hypothetical protein
MAKRQPKGYEILDVTSEVIRDYDLPSPQQWSDNDAEENKPTLLHSDAADQQRAVDSNSFQSTPGGASTINENIHFNQAATSSAIGDDASPSSLRQTESAVANLLYLSQGGEPQTPGDNSSLHTRLGPVPMEMISEYMDHIQVFTPDGPIEDGIFLPGSAYHELHSTLRNHLFQEVKSNGPTRPGTPDEDREDKRGNHDSRIADEDNDQPVDIGTKRSSAACDPLLLRKDEEIVLWRNWFEEIAPWLDKFDNERHFQNIIPTIAAGYDHLRYAMLALSARQLELKETTQPTGRSLALYQESIHLLLPHLPSRSTEVIASCVILCVLEMVSCSPKGWRRHLDGCASLMQAVGIDGLVGGVEQALFWCFARMDVCGGLISSARTLIPISHWASKMDLDADGKLYLLQQGFDMWANYVVFLVAQVLDLLAERPETGFGLPSRSDSKYRARWLGLWKQLCDWHSLRPAPLHSIMTIPSCDSSPFPTILFSNPAAISGNQLYHTASILMLQNQPSGTKLSPKPRSILWHARQVCAISISNDHHGAWTNAVQPLWIAGRCMSHPTEHRVILELLDKIERQSGWGTRWKAEDLKEFWGDLGD